MGKLEKADCPADYLLGEQAGHKGSGLQTMQNCIAQKGELWSRGTASKAGPRSAAGIYSMFCKVSATYLAE